MPSRISKRSNAGPDKYDIWFFDLSKNEIEELVCPSIDPERIIGKVIGKELKGSAQARYYFTGTWKECKTVFACLMLASTPWVEVRAGLYYVRKPEMSAHTAGIISGMHFRETTWDE